MLRKILDVFITKKFTQCKTLHTLKINLFEIQHNKNIGKLFPKYELLFLDQANSSSDPSQTDLLILRFPIPRASLPSLSSLSNFTLVNWSPFWTQSSSGSSCSSLFPYFVLPSFKHMPPQILDITNHMASYMQIIIPYGSKRLPIKKLRL